MDNEIEIIIDWFPKIIFCKIPEIIIEMIPNAGIIKNRK